jgi:hypothetical protein
VKPDSIATAVLWLDVRMCIPPPYFFFSAAAARFGFLVVDALRRSLPSLAEVLLLR